MQAEDSDTNPCGVKILTETFTKSVENKQDIFFLKDAANIPPVEKNIQTYIETTFKKYNKMTLETMLKTYHTMQQQLFKAVLKQSLQNYSPITKMLKNGGTSKNDFGQTFAWDLTLKDAAAHPIVSLYADKFTKMANTITKNVEAGNEAFVDVIPTVPTLVVGFEATLNYAIFACQYQSTWDDPIKKNPSTAAIIEEHSKQTTKVAQDLIQAKRILEYAMDSYDAFAVAYPQHIAYEELIKRLKVLRKQFYAFDQVNSKCVVPNHLYSSCKK